MLQYARNLIAESLRLSWIAANGLLGGLLGGGAMIWHGVLPIVSADETGLASVANWVLSFAIYATGSMLTLFIANLVFIAPFRVWKVEREVRIFAETKLKPRIVISYDFNNPSCRGITPVAVIGTEQRSIWGFFRLLVINTSALSISNCVGVLKEITNLETGEKAESQNLLWVSGPSGDVSVSLVPNAPMYLELCSIRVGNTISIGHGLPFRHEHMFDSPGVFLLKVTVGSDDTVWTPIEIEFNWTGDWQSSRMIVCANG